MRHSMPTTDRRTAQRCRMRRRAPAPRGVAMLLVIVSLMMATILTTSYLASRDNSVAIGGNVVSAAGARWVADSGLEFGIAVLQTDSPWRTSHNSGRLVSDLPLAGGSVDIDVIDMKTGLPPGINTEYVRMTSTGTINGVDQTAVAECHVPTTTQDQMDLDLSEFAIFASLGLSMDGTTTVARWPMSPLTGLGRRVQIGTQATHASSLTLSDDAASVDSTVFHGPGVSTLLVTVAKGQFPELVGFLDHIPMPFSPFTGVSDPPLISTAPLLNQSGGSIMTIASTRWKAVSLTNNAIRTLRGSITAVTDEDLSIASGAKLIIDGNVKLVVFGDTVIDSGSIELRPGARLNMYVRGRTLTALDIRDGYIGELRATPVRDATGAAAYMDPQRVQIFSVPGWLLPPVWTMRSNSVVKASIYAPTILSMSITDNSALYGRVASTNVHIGGIASVFYDSGLDTRTGYTSLDGAMWDNTQHLKTEVKTLLSLDATMLQPVADTLDAIVLATGRKYLPASGGGSGPGPVAPTDPTPRTIAVEARYVTFGSALNSWE